MSTTYNFLYLIPLSQIFFTKFWLSLFLVYWAELHSCQYPVKSNEWSLTYLMTDGPVDRPRVTNITMDQIEYSLFLNDKIHGCSSPPTFPGFPDKIFKNPLPFFTAILRINVSVIEVFILKRIVSNNKWLQKLFLAFLLKFPDFFRYLLTQMLFPDWSRYSRLRTTRNVYKSDLFKITFCVVITWARIRL